MVMMYGSGTLKLKGSDSAITVFGCYTAYARMPQT